MISLGIKNVYTSIAKYKALDILKYILILGYKLKIIFNVVISYIHRKVMSWNNYFSALLSKIYMQYYKINYITNNF